MHWRQTFDINHTYVIIEMSYPDRGNASRRYRRKDIQAPSLIDAWSKFEHTPAADIASDMDFDLEKVRQDDRKFIRGMSDNLDNEEFTYYILKDGVRLYGRNSTLREFKVTL